MSPFSINNNNTGTNKRKRDVVIAIDQLNDLSSKILELCKNKDNSIEPCLVSDQIQSGVMNFLSATPNDFDRATEHLELFISSSVPKALFRGYDRVHRDREVQVCQKKLVCFNDVFPFLMEISAELSFDLDSTMGTYGYEGLSFTLVRDFTAFVLPVWNALQLMDNDTHEEKFYENIGLPLCKMFYDLLAKMVCSLRLLDSTEKIEDILIVPWWSLYLDILKNLQSISKLYINMESNFWRIMKQVKGSLCYLIAKFAEESEHYEWLFEHKEVTNFYIRRQLAMMMLPEVEDAVEDQYNMLIDRSKLLVDSFEYIAKLDYLPGSFFVKFKEEQATGPGMLREWFLLACQEIFNPNNALFIACPDDNRSFFPNQDLGVGIGSRLKARSLVGVEVSRLVSCRLSRSEPESIIRVLSPNIGVGFWISYQAFEVNPLHLEYFRFSGRMIALALAYDVQIGVVFDRVFFLQLAGNGVLLEDIRDTDPFLYRSCKEILQMDAKIVDQDVLALTFVCEVESLGVRREIELCRNGKDIVVDSKNRETYVHLLIQHHYVTSIAEQVASDISVEDWKAHTDYNDYEESDLQISWFWKIVETMSVEQRKMLLFFWTSIKSLPFEGFGGLDSRMSIHKTLEPDDYLPSSHTCFYQLCFPIYQSMTEMEDRLRIITQGDIGSSFGTV
ncbi:hypothetical protein MTR67_046410 [Solanum verrucosum]|uniref:HECT-type E3 ubiquitin transferase n=1 Tax=Solanum verrucosum TaxID=315347 RepID=A0AAF0UVW1_SOLVR|nr:hypothetical protein MTR67_046410 [Solanum verrucosum]